MLANKQLPILAEIKYGPKIYIYKWFCVQYDNP